MITPDLDSKITSALEHRAPLFDQLHSEKTTAYRLFHGAVEGQPGLTIDRYGNLILVQTFRDPIPAPELENLEESLRSKLPYPFEFSYNHRGKTATQSFDLWHRPRPEALAELSCEEFGLHYPIRARHSGIDPWLFLDLRTGRRVIRERTPGLSVLNLFSYTCSLGLSAAAAGATEVWNVDFASSSLEVGRKTAQLNHIPESRFRTIQEDCFPVMRQLAGLPVGGRRSQSKKFLPFEARHFDFVVLDPPAWAKSPFGTVDVVGDYPTLFKSAVLATRPNGGQILATHHVPSVERETWIDTLKRCAAKAGRPIRSLEILAPEKDFPSFDGRHPLKIALCEV